MAIDAAMLKNIPEGTATSRHYGWLESAALIIDRHNTNVDWYIFLASIRTKKGDQTTHS